MIVDREELMERIDNDLEFLAETVEMFREDYPELLTQIHNGIDQHDSNAVAIAAHTLKGLVGNFAATPAADAAFELEKIARLGNLDQANTALVDLQREIQRLEQELVAILQGNQS